MQMAFYFDQTRCTGCFTCTVACKEWHNIPAGTASWRPVLEIEKGEFPEPFVAFLSMSCYHCARPACMAACPADAISKRTEDGIVTVNQEKCLGKDSCGLCLEACPYKAPQFVEEDNAKMQMCNFCIDRLAEGKKPICVDSCPTRALDAGPIKKLMSKYGKGREAEGFIYSSELAPSIVLKPKQAPVKHG
jgi:anaerobic dimethyl sulfoxide reductase subunit B (iron-sulfur subunit)